MNPTDPFSILAQVTPRARSEDELLGMAAALAPPPPAGYRPPAPAVPTSGVARFPQMPPTAGQNLAGGPQAPALIPPMTAGESRTNPRRGEMLMAGGGGY